MSDKMRVPLMAAVVVSPEKIPPHTTVLSDTEATQGIKLGHMRYVLGAALVLAVAAGFAMFLFF